MASRFSGDRSGGGGWDRADSGVIVAWFFFCWLCPVCSLHVGVVLSSPTGWTFLSTKLRNCGCSCIGRQDVEPAAALRHTHQHQSTICLCVQTGRQDVLPSSRRRQLIPITSCRDGEPECLAPGRALDPAGDYRFHTLIPIGFNNPDPLRERRPRTMIRRTRKMCRARRRRWRRASWSTGLFRDGRIIVIDRRLPSIGRCFRISPFSFSCCFLPVVSCLVMCRGRLTWLR